MALHYGKCKGRNITSYGFLGDRDYPFGPPSSPRRTRQPAPPAPPQDDDALAYYNETAKEDSDDFTGCVFHTWQTAMEEGREFQLPVTMANDEIARLGILVSEVPHAPLPLPRYATDLMPEGLTEDEPLERALQNSAPHLPPF
jgi:hypothetical protein